MKIEIQDLTVTRPGGIFALKGVSCVFDSHVDASVAVLGANGAGKSTLLESILGLVPFTCGRVVVDEMEVAPKNFHFIRQKIGMVFQNSDNQLFSQTVREDVAFGPTNLHLGQEEVEERTEKALQQLGITHLARREVTRLSGGEKRLAAVAGVLAMRPEGILMDEPTSMLDPRACRELAGHLNGMSGLKIIATHDLSFVRRVCRRCVILHDGKIFAEGTTDDILERHDLLWECGLA
ncbi:MAG: energy-coupling factor ABC transporter ATP-binding protein [Planctomycetia bacterium]|nr:energy-coupling factor ABC transporter ATP-binding protein [Planctomycetia bacterium]